MTEYGIFNDEGCIDSGLFSKDAAEARAQSWRTMGEACVVYALCPDHEEQPAHCCEECYGEED